MIELFFCKIICAFFRKGVNIFYLLKLHSEEDMTAH